MSEHISNKELARYIKLIANIGEEYDSNIDFINEIDSHIAECPECFEMVQTARLLTVGIVSDKQFVSVYENSTETKKASVKNGVILSINLLKDKISGNIRALAESVDKALNIAFVPSKVSLAGARGDGEVADMVANDLLNSNVELLLNGKKIVARCEKVPDSEELLLYIYLNDDLQINVCVNGQKLSPIRKDYDSVLNEHIKVYKLIGNNITLEI